MDVQLGLTLLIMRRMPFLDVLMCSTKAISLVQTAQATLKWTGANKSGPHC
jgi:hypothetical protein